MSAMVKEGESWPGSGRRSSQKEPTKPSQRKGQKVGMGPGSSQWRRNQQSSTPDSTSGMGGGGNMMVLLGKILPYQ